MWVARPEFTLLDGEGRPDLDPARGYDPEGWWTCDPATRDGDLAVLYRSRTPKDVSHLIAVRSDAEVLDDQAGEFAGWHVCRYQILARFSPTIGIARMRADEVVATWPALRADFVKRAFPVPDDVWARLMDLTGLDADALRAARVTGDRRFRWERELQAWLLGSGSGAFGRLGWTMELVGSEYACGRGRADLVYQQREGLLGRHVVVELKRGVVGRAAVEQVLGYREHLDRRRPWGRRRTAAILVGERLDDRARGLVRRDRRLSFVSIAELQGA